MISLGYSVFLQITKISGTKEKPGTGMKEKPGTVSNSNYIWTIRVNGGVAANVHLRWTASSTIVFVWYFEKFTFEFEFEFSIGLSTVLCLSDASQTRGNGSMHHVQHVICFLSYIDTCKESNYDVPVH